MNQKPFFDLGGLSENERCRVAANACKENPGATIGVIVDNDEKVISRYIRKIQGYNPLVTIERAGVLLDRPTRKGAGFLLKVSQPIHSKN